LHEVPNAGKERQLVRCQIPIPHSARHDRGRGSVGTAASAACSASKRRRATGR
jgi:hypothetical protein